MLCIVLVVHSMMEAERTSALHCVSGSQYDGG